MTDKVVATIAAAVAAWDRLNCAFNAGIEGTAVPTAEYDEAVFDSVIAGNLKGVFRSMSVRENRLAGAHHFRQSGFVANVLRLPGAVRETAAADIRPVDWPGRTKLLGCLRRRRIGPELEPSISGGGNRPALLPIHADAADIRHEHPRLARDVGAHVPALRLRI